MITWAQGMDCKKKEQLWKKLTFAKELAAYKQFKHELNIQSKIRMTFIQWKPPESVVHTNVGEVKVTEHPYFSVIF